MAKQSSRFLFGCGGRSLIKNYEFFGKKRDCAPAVPIRLLFKVVYFDTRIATFPFTIVNEFVIIKV